MKKIVVGILSQYDTKNDDDLFNNKSVIINTYPKKLQDLGCVTIGLTSVNGEVDENALKLCDAFLFQGGKRVQLGHFKVLDYAIKNNKPVLGICIGMQSMALYSYIRKILSLENKESYDDVCNKFNKLKNEGYIFFDKIQTDEIQGIYVTTEDLVTNEENIKKCYHDINIIDNSIMKSIYGSNTISAPSLHKFCIREYGDLFIPTAKSPDGIIESIEFVGKEHFILGVQYHPELMNDNLIFNRFIIEAEKRRKI